MTASRSAVLAGMLVVALAAALCRPSLAAHARKPATATTAPGALIVDVGTAPLEAVASRVAQAAPDADVEPMAVARFVRVSVPGDADAEVRKALARDARIVSVESDPVAQVADYVPSDPAFAQQWSATRVRATAAWDVVLGTPRTVVAVLDTGIDASHAELRGAAVPGVNLVHPGTPPHDLNGHGTAVAAIVAGRHNNGIGAAGTCPVCSVMPVKVLDDDGSAPLSRVADGIVVAVDRGARVVNVSLGAFGTSSALAAAVRHARDRGAVVVAAAGNHGDTAFGTEPMYPAAYPGVISVAASDPQDRRYSWSSSGSWVTVAAPGCNVTALLGGSVGTSCGTSSATPIVSGIVGLALTARPGAKGSVVESAVLSTAAPVGGYVARGRVDAFSAVRAVALLDGDVPAAPLWGRWAAVGDGVASAPGAVAWSDGRSDVFATTAAGELVHRYSVAGGAWGPSWGWERLGRPPGATVVGQPAASSRRDGWLDVFVRGSDRALWQRSYQVGSGWSPWLFRGGVLTSAPAVAAWGPDHVAVFAVGGDGAVWQRTWTRGWSPWRSLGGVATSAPGAAAWSRGRLDVVVRGLNGILYHRWYAGGRWSASWVRQGHGLHGDGRPDALSWGPGRIDVFSVATDGVRRRAYHSGYSWLPTSGFEPLGTAGSPWRSGTGALSWRPGHLHVFATDHGGRVWGRPTR